MDNRTSKPPDNSSSANGRPASDADRLEDRTLQLLRQLALRKDQDDAVRRVSSPADLEHHPARPEGTGAASENATSGRPWHLIAASLCVAGLLAGLLGFFLYYTRPAVQSTAPAERVAPPPVASPSDRAAPTAVQSVRQAMADCDRDAQADPGALHLLLIPIKPDSDSARTEIPPGEAYSSFFLMTSQAALAGLQAGSYVMNAAPFGVAIRDSATNQTRTWNFVVGLTRLTHKDPNGFANFQIGFDLTGRGYDLQWTGQFPRRPGVCYWANVRFRL